MYTILWVWGSYPNRFPSSSSPAPLLQRVLEHWLGVIIAIITSIDNTNVFLHVRVVGIILCWFCNNSTKTTVLVVYNYMKVSLC